VPAAALAVSSFGEAAAGEPRWLIQGLWPADAYGVLAAQEKAGKTWAALDLAVSVATGRPWLDHFACPGLRLDLERYLRYYDTERAHTGRWTNGRTPKRGPREGQAVAQEALMRRHNSGDRTG
jgi:AAA domain